MSEYRTARVTVPDFGAVVTGLRRWYGRYHATDGGHVQVAVELLIEHETWLRSGDFWAAVCLQSGRDGMVRVNWPEVRAFAYAEGGPPCSPGDRAILRLAIAIAGDDYQLAAMGRMEGRMAVTAFTRVLGVDAAHWHGMIDPDEPESGDLRNPVVAWAMRRLRRERGMSYREVGQLLGMAASNVCRAEHGERTPPPAGKVAEAFGVPLAAVLSPCPHCHYSPPTGYMCLRCGITAGRTAPTTPTGRRPAPGHEQELET